MAILSGWRRKLLAAVVVLTVLVGVAVGGGCGSFSLPPKPTDAQLAILRSTHFRATVGVEPYKYPVYSEHLVSDLRSTGLFDAVELLDKIEKPTLVARVERPVYGKAAIPFWTIVTLGIVPTTVEEEHGHAFSFRPASRSEAPVLIDYTYRGPSTLGWVAFFLNFAPNRSGDNPIETPRFREGLAIAVSSRREQIANLLSHPELPNPSLQNGRAASGAPAELER
jgi:hypothetical protein